MVQTWLFYLVALYLLRQSLNDTSNYQQSPTVTSSHHLSPAGTTCHQQSPPVTSSHQLSPAVTNSHLQSPTVASSHHLSPAVTTCRHQSPLVTTSHPQSPLFTPSHTGHLRPAFCWKWTYRSVLRATTTITSQPQSPRVTHQSPLACGTCHMAYTLIFYIFLPSLIINFSSHFIKHTLAIIF